MTPYARNMPYDVYATLAFFGARPGKPEKLPIDTARRPVKPPTQHETPQSLSPVLVTPLLVTDNLEGALKSRSVNTIRDFLLALSVLTGKVDVDSKLTAYTDQLSRVLGTDLNSLFTVSQVNDNSVRVRLGAARQATSGYAMIPRTHNVTLLVLVPKELESRKLRVEGATELRDATKGDALDTPSSKSRRKAIHEKLKHHSKYVYPTSPEWAHYCYEGLKSFLLYDYDAWTASSDFTRFEQALYTACETTTASGTLWMELVELSGNRPYARASFELPEPRAPRLPDAHDQEVILRDSSKTGKMTAILRGGKDLRKGDLFATLDLYVQREGAQAKCRQISERVVECTEVATASSAAPTKTKTYDIYPLRLLASDIEVQAGGRGYIKLTFPSLAKEELGQLWRGPPPKLTLRLVEDSRWKDDREPYCVSQGETATSRSSRPSYDRAEPKSRDHVACQTYERIAYVLFDPEAPKPEFEMTTGTSIVRSDKDGTGTLGLSLSTEAAATIEVQLEIGGALVTKITGATDAEVKSKTFKIHQDQGKDLVISLANFEHQGPG